jgi:hypothetical protein
VVFLGLGASAELLPKFHVALHASHATLQNVITKFCSNAASPPNVNKGKKKKAKLSL